MNPPKHILPLIVFAQFVCTSLWFAGNGIAPDLAETFQLNQNAIGYLTSSVQLGFIVGTLAFAVLTITDRFSPSLVFFVNALLGAIFNLSIIIPSISFSSVLMLRFITGVFLAGIYPVGMKIAADYFDKSLGKSLGYLVGALVLGTSLPHLLKGAGGTFQWQFVIISTSFLAFFGGVVILLRVPDGPLRKGASTMSFTAFAKVFKQAPFRSAAFGYFGHMWELYTFWAFVPLFLLNYSTKNNANLNISLISFGIIAIGGLACILGGHLSLKLKTKTTATIFLAASALCCLIFPFAFQLPASLFLIFLFFWGFNVVGDSPLFSTLVAQNADVKIKGTALTIVNSMGFAITIVSIQLLSYLQINVATDYKYWILAIGPIIGLIAMYNQKRNPSSEL